MAITSFSQLDPTKQYTYADYLTWEIEERLEIIKGWVMRMSAPSISHQKILRHLVRDFEHFFADKYPCEYFFVPTEE